jgi:hypothetical protein
MLRHTENTASYTAQETLAIIAGWQPETRPVHRTLEREAMEMIDQAERDYAARVTYARRSAQ